MNWNPETYQALLAGEYQKVAELYERALELEPDNITNYWYLGLAYLLQEKEEEAQTTWLLVFSQADGEETKIWTEELADILEQEARRQTSLENYLSAWVIRGHLREIVPDRVNNILNLVKLGIALESLHISNLQEWNLLELLKQNRPEDIDRDLFLAVFEEILKVPTRDSINFAQASLIHTQGDSALIELVMGLAEYMAHDQKFFLYSAELLEECLPYQPDNIYLLKDLFWYYKLSFKFDKALELAHRFDKLCQNLAVKLYSKYQFIYAYLERCDWIEFQKLVEDYKQLLQTMATEQPAVSEQFIRESFLITLQPLLYIQDNPRENRYFLNHLAQLFQKHTQEHHACAVNFVAPDAKNKPRKLKIGYIGHTLRNHSVGLLSRWLLHYHNREEFEIAVYLVNQLEDDITQKWFTEQADICHNLNRNVNNIITQIEKDEIDILVDLDSLTHNLTNLVMSLKPAPIQVTWLGLDASGIPAIDYFIADPYVLPDDAQDYYQEKIWRLPLTYIAVDGFEVGYPTLRREDLDIPEDAVVYFNVQNSLKRNPHGIHLQMKILKQVANSYLLIKGTGEEDIVREMFNSIAEKEGVSPAQLRFLERYPTPEIHRANLQIADVVLDTYPYNGATTTLETLWMGIPLVTRVGEQFAARNSYAFMVNVGVTEGIAWSDREYVEWGVRLGTDEQLRQKVAWKLRQSRKSSPLWNTKEFTREMEKAYQQMWVNYLDSNQ